MGCMVVGSHDQLCTMVMGCINCQGRFWKGGRGGALIFIVYISYVNIKITEPLSPRWNEKLLEHQVWGEFFPLVLKLLGTNSM